MAKTNPGQRSIIILYAALAVLPVCVLTAFFVWPVTAIIMRGLTETATFFEIIFSARSLQVATQTLLQAISATVLSVVLGVPAAYVLYCCKFYGRNFLRALLTVPFVLPTVVVALAFGALYGPGGPLEWLGLDRTFILVVLALTFFNVTVIARTTGSFWSNLDSGQADAARCLGAGPVRVFCTITLPQLAPAILSAAALVFLFCATSFGIVLILGGRRYANIEAEIYYSAVQFLDLQTAAVLSFVQIFIVLGALWLQTKMRSRAETVKTKPQNPKPINFDSLILLICTLISLFCLQGLPLIALILRSFTREGNFTLANYASLAEHDPMFNGSVLEAAGLSLRLAFIAAFMTLAIGLAAALIVSRKPRTFIGRACIQTLDTLFMLPVGVSAVTLGFGLLITMHNFLGFGVDLRSSGALLAIAQTLVALPLVLRVLLPALRTINERNRDAARILGASELRVICTIDLPQVAPLLAVAAGFAFAAALGEFGASSFLVRPQLTTLPVVIGQLASRPGSDAYGTAMAAAVLMGAIAAGIMLLAEKFAFSGSKKLLTEHANLQKGIF